MTGSLHTDTRTETQTQTQTYRHRHTSSHRHSEIDTDTDTARNAAPRTQARAHTHMHTHKHSSPPTSTALVDKLKSLRESALRTSGYDCDRLVCVWGGGGGGGQQRVAPQASGPERKTSNSNLMTKAPQNTRDEREGEQGRERGEGREGEGENEKGTLRVLSDAHVSCTGAFCVCMCV